MASKNLSFKLVMDADTNKFITNLKQAKQTAEQMSQSIGMAVESVEKTSKKAGNSIGDVIPSETRQKVAQLVSELYEAQKVLDALGDDAAIGANALKELGVDGQTALDGMLKDLANARQHLNYLSATSATPADLEKAQQKVKDLEIGIKQVKTAFDSYKASASSASTVTGSIDQAMGNLGEESMDTATKISKLDQELAKTNAELAQTQSLAQRTSAEVQGLKNGFNTLSGALAALGIGVTAADLAQTADAFKSLEARVALSVGQAGNFEAAMQGVNDIAIETRANLVATGELFSRVNTAVKELGYSQEQALAITKTINQAMIIGGGSAASNEAAITQLNQALQSGVLRGEEFNSIMEQSPRLARALADGLKVSIGKLREMAEAGKLTTDTVLKAIQGQASSIEKEFATMPVTIGQSIENLKTSWMTYLGELDKTHNVSARVAEALKMVAENLDSIFSILTLATQAFIAYKALNIANVFLDKAAGARAASLAIAQETVAITANTQAQLANAAATKATTAAKGQMAVASGAAATASAATVTSVGALVGRLGALGLAVTAVGVLIPTVFEPIGTYIGEGIAKLQGYGDVLERVEQQELASVAAAKAAAESKQQIAAAAEKARDKAYQLTTESKKLVAEFDELVKKGTPVKDALEKVAQAMKFDSTKGINDAVTALVLLKDQGKITADELQGKLGKALDGQNLVVFQTNAKAAFAGTAQAATKSAEITQAVMQAALARTGLSTEQLQGKFSKAFQSASNDVQLIINNLEEYKAQGVDTGLALAANLNKAIDTAQTRAELDYAKSSLIEFGKQGKIAGEQVALGLSLIEEKAAGLPDILNPAQAAFNSFGIKTKQQLNDAAVSAQKNFEVVKNSGMATADGIKTAYTKMLDAAISSGDKARIAQVQAQAASLGLQTTVDETGKATVKSMNGIDEAVHRLRNSTRDAEQGFRDLGRAAREEAKDSITAWNDVMEAQGEAERKNRGNSRTGVAVRSITKAQIEQELRNMGYSEQDAKQKASSIYNEGINADKSTMQKNTAYGEAGRWTNKMFQDLHDAGKTATQGTIAIEKLLAQAASNVSPNVNDRAPSIAQPMNSNLNTEPAKTVRYQFTNADGQQVDMYGSEQSGNALEEMLSELEMLKKAR